MSVDIALHFNQVLCRVSCTLSADSLGNKKCSFCFLTFRFGRECFGVAILNFALSVQAGTRDNLSSARDGRFWVQFHTDSPDLNNVDCYQLPSMDASS